MTRHPAKFNLDVLTGAGEALLDLCDAGPAPLVLDPFAGVGGVHTLAALGIASTIGVELEPEWALQHPRNILGSALDLPFPADTFDAIVTSPCYGNRMADHHDAKDASERNTYRHALGRSLSEDNSGAMQWGMEYQMFHRVAWGEAHRVLVPGGLMVLNVGNHIRRGTEQHVAEWHLRQWTYRGARVERIERIRTPGLRAGANHNVRVGSEMLMVLRVP